MSLRADHTSMSLRSGHLKKTPENDTIRPQLQHLFVDNKFFTEPWHAEDFMEPPPEESPKEPWRLKEKMKTSGVALVVCLNLGTDPPDIVKPTPCARRECWFDPTTVPKQKGLEVIGNALQQQYEKWHSKAKYKLSLDPTSSELERTCINLRRQTRSDRLLLHYNGHGVPRPTKNGELWVFGKHYTHYMPVNVYELRQWLGDPSIYVLDCSGAGALLPYFNEPSPAQGMEARSALSPNEKNETRPQKECSSTQPCIVLAACQAHEMLPIMNQQYPADLFTSCLTTPIPIAVRWFILQNPHISSQMSLDISEHIPGKDSDRKTPKGELNWIFTAVADTIAWSCLPSATFQKLFRQDLLVASLFRNFLLAKRIMRSLNCSPQSIPSIPDVASHPLWHAWDSAVEHCLLHVQSLQQKQQQQMSTTSVSPGRMPVNVPPSMNPSASKGFLAPRNEAVQGQRGHAEAQYSNNVVGKGVPQSSQFPAQLSQVKQNNNRGHPSDFPGHLQDNQARNQQQQQQQSSMLTRYNTKPPPSLVSQNDKSFMSPGGVVPPSLSTMTPGGYGQSPRASSGQASSASTASSSPFFSEQMTAFEVWLDFGGRGGSYVSNNRPPMCLPILLQALLSHAHRLKSLHLLRRYVALGPEAVHSILAVGNYPYILKLLHNPVAEIRHVLMSIWTYVLGFDRSCREELVKDMKDKGKSQFMECLQNVDTPHQQRTMAAFILAEICNGYKPGQLACLSMKMHEVFIDLISSKGVQSHPHLRKWLAFCLAKLCEDMPQCKKQCILDEVQLYLYPLLLDAHPFVRSAALLALGELLGASKMDYPEELPEGKVLTVEQWKIREKELEIAIQVLESCQDGCALVRREAVVALSKIVMLPIHYECMRHVAKAVFEHTGETSFHKSDYLSPDRERSNSSQNPSPPRGNTATTRATFSNLPSSSSKHSTPRGPESSPPASRSSKSLFSLPSPLKSKNSKSNVFNSESGSSPPPPQSSPEWKNARNARSNSQSESIDSAAMWSLNSEYTMALIKDIQELVESRLDLSKVQGTSLFPQSRNSPPAPNSFRSREMYGRKGASEYGIGVGFDEPSTSPKSEFLEPPSVGPPSQQQQHVRKNNAFGPTSSNSDTDGNAPMDDKSCLRMATSYVHLWLSLFEVQSCDSHPIVSKCVRAIFMHMKVEIAKEVFNAASVASTDEDDQYSAPRSSIGLSSSSASNRGERDSSNDSSGVTEMTDDKGSRISLQHGGASSRQSSTLHLNDRPGQEYGKHRINQDRWLMSTVYDWNRHFFLQPDIGYNPYDDLLSEVGKERSLRMSMREEVKRLSNRIVENFRPIRDDGLHSLIEGDNLQESDSESVNMRETKARSTGSHGDDESLQASLLPSSLTKFENRGILRMEHADLSTSTLMFHAFHDILAVSDIQGVGIWSLESGTQILRINADTHMSTSGPRRCRGSTSMFGQGLISPQRHQYNSMRSNPPYDPKDILKPRNLNSSNPNSMSKMPNRGIYGSAPGSSNSFIDAATSRDSSFASTAFQVGGYGDPFHKGADSKAYLNSKEGKKSHVTSMHWINESMDTLLMVGMDDGNVRIFRDMGSGIESSLHVERESGSGFSESQGVLDTTRASRHSGEKGSIFSGKSHASDPVNASTSPGVTLASAFHALPDISPTGMAGSGMVSSWQQSSGMLSVGGNSSTIRVWDVGREMCVTTFKTGVETCLTCLESQAAIFSPESPSAQVNGDGNSMNFSESGATGGAGASPVSWGDTVANSMSGGQAQELGHSGHLPGSMRSTSQRPVESSFAWSFAGFADGSIGIFDQRVSSYGGKVHAANEHNSWIVSAHLRADIPEIITGAYTGVVKFWDVRMMRSYKTVEVHKTQLTSVAVHNCAPIMATGSPAQFIKILTLGGDQLGMIRHHEGFRGQRIGPVAALTFHPVRLLMAAACTDNLVSIYSIQDG